MPAFRETIARRAFDAIAAAQKVATVADLDLTIRAALMPFGYSVVAGVNAVDSCGKANVQVLFGQTHAAWEAHYQARGYARCDAIIRRMLKSTEPAFWSDLVSTRCLSADEQRVFQEAGTFGLSDGFMTPLHNLDGSISAVLLMGDKLEITNPDMRAASHILSIYYGSIGRRLQRSSGGGKSAAEKKVSLSGRQVECLKWVRAGKSSSDIGDILNLSHRTVDEHIATACARLGVRTRVQAVAEAAITGALDL
jgi:LuxR family quorum sensing-dependent transcriptional regulator